MSFSLMFSKSGFYAWDGFAWICLEMVFKSLGVSPSERIFCCQWLWKLCNHAVLILKPKPSSCPATLGTPSFFLKCGWRPQRSSQIHAAMLLCLHLQISRPGMPSKSCQKQLWLLQNNVKCIDPSDLLRTS